MRGSQESKQAARLSNPPCYPQDGRIEERDGHAGGRRKGMQFLEKQVTGLDRGSCDPPNPLQKGHLPTRMNSLPPRGQERLPSGAGGAGISGQAPKEIGTCQVPVCSLKGNAGWAWGAASRPKETTLFGRSMELSSSTQLHLENG